MIDLIAAALTAISVWFYPSRTLLAAVMGALGCALWIHVGISAALPGVWALNGALLIVNAKNAWRRIS